MGRAAIPKKNEAIFKKKKVKGLGRGKMRRKGNLKSRRFLRKKFRREWMLKRE